MGRVQPMSDTTSPTTSSEKPTEKGPEQPVSKSASLRADALSGFLVFLIALPLCLGISIASGFPPVAGILTAIVGGLIVSPLMGAPLTIKGPAAGLIVIAIGAVTELGVEGDPSAGYRRALATIVVAGVLQVVLGVVKAGRLADFFPSSVVHGMLAAIGVIICAKQFHVMLGVAPEAREPFGLIAEIPHSITHLNPEIVLIGVIALFVLFAMPMIKSPLVKRIPAPMVVLAIAVPLGFLFDLGHEHTYSFLGSSFEITPRALVNLPDNLLGSITMPDWSVVTSPTSIRYIVMFTLVGSIESLLSARAIDQLDTRRLKSDYDRDLLAVGVGNAISGMIGGLPMIAEIVRSKANLDNGARSRWSNFFHGCFLLVCVAFLPMVIHRIPLAALAAMLVYTGTRLASPGEVVKTWKIGREQLFYFALTAVVCIGVDLLAGVAAGVLAKLLLELALGASPKTIFRPAILESKEGDTQVLTITSAATFTNYLSLKGRVLTAAAKGPVAVDIARSPFVDHTTMERLHDLEGELKHEGKKLEVRGADRLTKLSEHPAAARRSIAPPAAA